MTKATGSSELVERLREEIAGWESAYPLTAFPEPDLERAAAVLRDAGMTLDAISASNMRHVVSRLAPFIHEAADALDAKDRTIGRLREALEPFALLADAIEHTDHRDGNVVHRQICNGQVLELNKNDFRRAAEALKGQRP